MLEQALAAEKQAIVDYDERLRQAEDFGMSGSKVSLENQIADETRHKEELESVLAGWDKDREQPTASSFTDYPDAGGTTDGYSTISNLQSGPR